MDSYLSQIGLAQTVSMKEVRDTVVSYEFGLTVRKNKLGFGCSGSVFSCDSPNGEQYVVKWFGPFTTEQRTDFLQEAKPLRAITTGNHSNVIELKHDFQLLINSSSAKFLKDSYELEDKPDHHAILKKMDSNFKTWMKDNTDNDRLSEDQCIDIFLQIGAALEFIYLRHFLCHRDLKLDNIGVVGNVQPGFLLPTLKLLDFGISKFYDIKTYEESQSISGQFSMKPAFETLRRKLEMKPKKNKFIDESYDFSHMRIPSDIGALIEFLNKKKFKKIMLGLSTGNFHICQALKLFSEKQVKKVKLFSGLTDFNSNLLNNYFKFASIFIEI